jgi:hypothetical protein
MSLDILRNKPVPPVVVGLLYPLDEPMAAV